MMKKRVLSLLLAGAACLSLSACGGSPATESAAPSADAAPSASQTAENDQPYAGTTLNFITSYGGVETTFEKFTEKTGINIEFVPMSSGEALAKLVAEDGKTNVDIWLGGGVDAFLEAKDLGYLEPYVSPESEGIDDMYKDPDGYWTGVSLQCAGFMVNNDLIAEKGLPIPETWEDLADPVYKGELIIANPSVSGTNYAMLSGLIQSWGEDKAWDYFDRLCDNVDFFVESGGDAPKKVAAGEFAVGVVPMTGEFFAYEDSYPVTMIYPQDLLPWTPAPIAIFKNSQNMDAAKLFVDYLLSEEGQEQLRSSDPRIMTRTGVEAPAEIGNVDMDTLVKLDVAKMGADRTAILEKWADLVGEG